MKFSLRMVKEVLTDFKVEEVYRTKENRTIENIRLYFENDSLSESTLYIESSDMVFRDKKHTVVCVHGENMLRVHAESVNTVFNRIIQFFEERSKWEEKINNMITSNCLLKDVLSQFRQVLPMPVMVLDNGQMVLAMTDNYKEGQLDRQWDIALETGRFDKDVRAAYNEMHQSRIAETGFYELPADPFPYPSFNHNIFIENEFVGFISMILIKGFLEVHKDWFEIVCEAVLKWVTLYMQQNEILFRRKLLVDLLSGNPEHIHKLENTMQTIGWRQKDRKHLFVIRCISDVLNTNLHIARLLNHLSNGLYAVEYQNEIVLLTNERIIPETRFRREVIPMLQKSGYYGGESDVFYVLNELHQNYLQARVAMEQAAVRPGEFHHIRNHMVPYIFQVILHESDMDMRHPCLAALKEYDRKHGSDLYRILYVYLRCNGSQTMAAEKLYMHRNSLIRKIERIKDVFPVDLNDYEIRLHLMMSYEMDRLLEG